MKMSYTYGIFETDADHLIELVRTHAPLAEIRAAGCPVCKAAITVTFAEAGTLFSIACKGNPIHLSAYRDITDPPSWWRECVFEPTDEIWHWQADHGFDADGNLSMPVSRWQVDGIRWSGSFSCPTTDADYAFWRWVVLEAGCTSNLIGNAEVAELRDRFLTQAKGLPTD